MEKRIRNSAKALIIKNGKMAAVKLQDGDGSWYIMPGGGQEPGEVLSAAVCREVAEELGFDVVCKELLFVVEGLHNEQFHRVDFVFLCDYVGESPDMVKEPDLNQVGFEWLDIATLNREKLFPSKLRCQIMNYYYGKPYQTYLGSEEAGDPECLS